MKAVNYSDFRINLKGYIDQIYDDFETLFVVDKKNKGRDIVVMSKAEYDSMQETLYLLSTANNAERLQRGIRDFETSSNVKSRELYDVFDDI